MTAATALSQSLRVLLGPVGRGERNVVGLGRGGDDPPAGLDQDSFRALSPDVDPDHEAHEHTTGIKKPPDS